MNIKFFSNMFKLTFLAISLFFFCSCGFWWGTFQGSGYKLFLQKTAKNKQPIACRIEGKRLFLFGEDVHVPYFSFKAEYRVYHILYENESDRKSIATYKFPLTYGIGAVDENADFVIIESEEFVAFYYNRKPVDGFNVVQNPFSKKILFEQRDDLFDLIKNDGACYYMR